MSDNAMTGTGATDTATLLSMLRARDVKLWVEDDRLRVSAPAGALDAGLRAALGERKTELLAFLTRAAARDSLPASIVPIKPDGHRPPIFAVSGHGGDVYALLGLARHLDAEQPVFGVQPPGLDGSAPLTTVEALARYEIEQIRKFQPQGPYLIAGHCAGGTIAFEVARQLTADGQEIALLALIGSPFPTTFGRIPQALVYLRRHAKALMSGSRADRWRYVMDKLHGHIQQPQAPAISAATFAARQRVERATVVACSAYVPQHYDGALDLFITAETWHRSERWQAFAARSRAHVIAGHDIDPLLLGPDVSVLADLLQARLDTGFR